MISSFLFLALVVVPCGFYDDFLARRTRKVSFPSMRMEGCLLLILFWPRRGSPSFLFLALVVVVPFFVTVVRPALVLVPTSLRVDHLVIIGIASIPP